MKVDKALLRYFLWILGSFHALVAVAQGPITGFMPGRHHLTLASSYGGEAFDLYFDEAGLGREESLEQSFVSNFLEYGFSDSFSIVATLPHISIAGGQRGWQDAGLWLKFRNSHRFTSSLAEKSFVTGVGLSFPVSRYNTDGAGSIGRRATTFQGRIAWQQSHPSGWFIHAQTGIDFQFVPSAEIALPVVLRAGRGGRWSYFDLWLERYSSLRSVTDASLTVGAGSTWTRVGGTLYLPVFPFLGINSGLAYILKGQNIGQALRWNLGLVVQIQ